MYNSSYDFLSNISEIMQDNSSKIVLINFLNKINEFQLKDIKYNGIEKFQSIVEYDFYLINLIGITNSNEKKEMFIKIIKKGKIKESLFCICDLIYEKFFNNNAKEILEKKRKITIIEEENIKHLNKVFVNIFGENLNQENINIEINFIEISKIIEHLKNKKINKKGWEEYIGINLNDIIIIGVKNKYWFIGNNLV